MAIKTGGIDDLWLLKDVAASLGGQPLKFGDFEQICAIRWIELGESLVGKTVECAECDGLGDCHHCYAECSVCKGSGHITLTREKLDSMSLYQLRKLYERAIDE